jgi:CBS domain-containing protein
MRNYIRGNNNVSTFRERQRHHDRQPCLLHTGAHRAASSRDNGQARQRRIAIVENVENLKPIGVITDRDIAWRVVATGKSPAETSVRDAMLSCL